MQHNHHSVAEEIKDGLPKLRKFDRRELPPIEPTERSIVRETSDGVRISLPRVAWLDRPMPGGSR